MKSSHSTKRMSAVFDDPNLVDAAGLVPLLGLAGKVGVPDLVAERLTVPGPAGANPSAKVMTLIAGMAAGADCIDDMDWLRQAGMGQVFSDVRAPSTLGTFLREFTFGHVRQLDAVASRALIAMEGTTTLLPGIEAACVIDIDDTARDVYGPAKQGAQFGYTKTRCLNAQLGIISTPTCAPVIGAARLRKGAAHSARGAVRMIGDVVATARRCGAGTNILVRADSAYCNSAVVAAITRAGATFCLAIPQHRRVTAAIAGIGQDAWTRITYPWKIPDPETGEFIDAAEVAEIEFTAFTSKPKKDRVTARLIVRRIPERNPKKQQGELFTGYRYHAVFTNTTTPLVAAESTYRGHAIVEQVIRDLKNSALAHLPSGRVRRQRRLAGLRHDRVQPHPHPGSHRRRETGQSHHRHHPSPPDPGTRPSSPLRAPPDPAPTPELALGKTLDQHLDLGHDHLTPGTSPYPQQPVKGPPVNRPVETGGSPTPSSPQPPQDPIQTPETGNHRLRPTPSVD